MGRWAVSFPSLVDLVKLQIGERPEDLRDIVDLVCVADPLEYTHLITLVEPDAVEAAAQRGLIEVSTDGSTIRAGHPLYSEIRWEQCGPRRLRQLRTQVVKAMMSNQGVTPVDPLRLGMLWLESDFIADPEVFSAAANALVHGLIS